jgi:SAM-dependent methyltransferase
MESAVTTNELNDQNVALNFYEDRYKDDYMDEWPSWKKQRIADLIKKLNLPQTGKALDFGCGRGIFTQVLKQTLPNWEVTGCDISQNAMNAGQARFPNCRFQNISKLIADQEKFDLIFSHHVLEHVSELENEIADMSKLQLPGARIFHVLPCGNEGSLEHNLASSIPNGINPAIKNRFYYEDIGHLRRLSSAEMDSMVKTENYLPEKAWFANQQFGSLGWMSETPEEFILESLTNLDLAKGDQATKEQLLALRNQIARLKTARKLAKEGLKHRVKTRLNEIKSKPLSLFGQSFQLLEDYKLIQEGLEFEKNLANEWELESENLTGSEMYLVYKKA